MAQHSSILPALSRVELIALIGKLKNITDSRQGWERDTCSAVIYTRVSPEAKSAPQKSWHAKSAAATSISESQLDLPSPTLPLRI